MGVLPGAVVALIVGRGAARTWLQLFGTGAALTAALVQLVTIASLSLHMSVRTCGMLLAAWNVAGAVVAWRVRRHHRLRLPGSEVVLGALLLALACLFYLQEASVGAGEDNIHLSLIRRLAELDAPRLDNIYFAPGVVHSYPFPGTHFWMALISRFGDVDALFVYHKLRFFWVTAALTFVFLSARVVFRSGRIAIASTVVAAAFVASGAFAAVPGFSWGQLAPFSHPSDVALGVILPAFFVFMFRYLSEGARTNRAFLLGAALSLALMLTMVHIREIV